MDYIDGILIITHLKNIWLHYWINYKLFGTMHLYL